MVVEKVSLKKIIGGLFVSAIGYYIGDNFGKCLHDILAYLYPIKEFSKYSWFDAEQYIKLYNFYSNNLRDVFGLVFGIVGAGLSLACYIDLLYRWKR